MCDQFYKRLGKNIVRLSDVYVNVRKYNDWDLLCLLYEHQRDSQLLTFVKRSNERLYQTVHQTQQIEYCYMSDDRKKNGIYESATGNIYMLKEIYMQIDISDDVSDILELDYTRFKLRAYTEEQLSTIPENILALCIKKGALSRIIRVNQDWIMKK